MNGKHTAGLGGSVALGTIHPFGPHNSSRNSFLKMVAKEMDFLMAEPKARRIIAYAAVNIVCVFILLLWCHSTNSMALTAYSYLAIFDLLRLLTALITLWVQKQGPSSVFSFGYERFEVLAVFSSTMLAQLGSFFIIKESVERMIQQPDVHEGRLLLGALVAFLVHIFMTYSVENKAFNHVVEASSSSWLQEHVADISEGFCKVVPGLSRLLLPRINPFALIAFAGATALFVTYVLIDMYNYQAADTWAAMCISVMTFGTMFPMAVYSGMILLQTTPTYVIGQLDKCLREASTLDGVLEFRNEHFWTLSFGKLAGSLHVRIRRDAQEQLVLAHVSSRLSNIVSDLTVQVFKDDWTRPTAYQIIHNSPFHSESSLSTIGVTPPVKLPLGSETSSMVPPGIQPFTPYKSGQYYTSTPMVPQGTSAAIYGSNPPSAFNKTDFATDSLTPIQTPQSGNMAGVIPGKNSVRLQQGYRTPDPKTGGLNSESVTLYAPGTQR
ncbi:zinc transporter 6-A-like isoform X1 [Lingula anatina]|uniref:Zinc transporter 6-A-like isoform X1 n=2 Tax=Lingula anatina TaxID=7574 RepID=A0A1S3IMJ4_LINAN|nr:zinc transporter 6-A-like isoform X1 [Lingula anatina]XP_013398761.1 zinc transporter 6-A-like isoform X1 [Lingula anatina]|eukprot:XP_013398754.1 zinc transporter 6-A-like isoform X1 [Lingula anatina]